MTPAAPARDTHRGWLAAPDAAVGVPCRACRGHCPSGGVHAVSRASRSASRSAKRSAMRWMSATQLAGPGVRQIMIRSAVARSMCSVTARSCTRWSTPSTPNSSPRHTRICAGVQGISPVAVTPTGTPVRIASTAPTNDRWNLTAVELHGRRRLTDRPTLAAGNTDGPDWGHRLLSPPSVRGFLTESETRGSRELVELGHDEG